MPTEGQEEFYDRKATRHDDGTVMFTNDGDRANERVVAELIEKAWGCKTYRFPDLFHLDFYAEKNRKMVAVIEIKCRAMPSDGSKYRDVYLSLQKWLHLTEVSSAFLCSGIFVVKFEDDVVKYIRVDEVDPRYHIMSGTVRQREIDSPSKWEPMILVPIKDMREVR
jgi:hypothetical protein